MYLSILLRGIGNGCGRQRMPLLALRLHTASQTRAPSKNTNEHMTRSNQVFIRLAKGACALREAIHENARQKLNSPTLLVDLERDVESAFAVLNNALDALDRPCSVEQLADRKIDDDSILLGSALSYADVLKAQLLRDDIEKTLVNLQVMPPREALLKGAGRLAWKGTKKEQRGAGSAALLEDPDSLSEEEGTTEPKELYPATESLLAERKKQMEKATDVKQLLRGFDTALLEVSRVHKVVKGGTNMSMRALVAIGDRKGTAGFGEGKSENVQHAIERACRDARRNLLHIDLCEGRTIRHRVCGSFVRTKVDVWPAPVGRGISANNVFAVILALFGLQDVGAKLRGTRPLLNSVKALFNALSKNSTPESIAAVRGEGFVPVDTIDVGSRIAMRKRDGP